MAQGLFTLRQVNQAIRQGAWSAFNPPQWVEYLCVAGGGGGGGASGSSGQGGGGGAGGLLTGMVPVVAGTSYTVTVGAGGSGSASSGIGGTGVSSVFGSISTLGGGGGGTYSAKAGVSGGSGGGAGGDSASSGATSGGSGTSGQGNAGGNIPTGGVCGGGGGAGTVGLNATGTYASAGIGGNGGAGIASSISGTVTTYAGGGGGSSNNVAGTGGVGGGGAGGVTSAAGTAGTANTGGGGGGHFNANTVAGAGGSGIVVVRYPGSIQFFTGGTLSYANGYIIHTFYANGTLAPTTPTPYITDYQISRSLRFNKTDQAYLERTPSTSGNQKTWTQSLWVKRSSLSTQQDLYSPYYGGNGSDESQAYFNSSDQLAIYDSGASAGYMSYVTTQVFRDVSAWYHIVFACDTTQATASDRLKIYVNGVQITSFTSSQTQTQNTNTGWNGTSLQRIGSYARTTNATLDGYMTEFYNIDGQALTPSSFGYTNPVTGVWSPHTFVGTYGTNGFYVNFSDNSNTTAATLGKDYSGNGNNWTPNNFSVTAGAGNDSLVDSPTSYGVDTGVGGSVRGNYSTMNPLDNSGMTLSNGNLDGSHTGNTGSVRGSVGISSGKWYWEMTITAVGSYGQGNVLVGIATNTVPLNVNADANLWAYWGGNGTKWNTSASAYGASFGNGDVIGIAYDADSGSITFYKNNVSQGVAFSSIPTGTYLPWFNSGGGGSAIYGTSWATNFGQRPFAYTAPSGYKALCTQNLPTPTIGATSATLASQFFAPVLYTGNGATQSITVGFQPDWVWYKSRSSAVYNHGLFDSVRGATAFLVSNSTQAETTVSGVTAFNSGGFTVGSDAGGNESGGSMVAWNWRASNATAVTNTSGSITSQVSANPTAGFSVVTYTASGVTAARTVGHGLGVAPSFMMIRSRSDSDNWYAYHTSIGNTKAVFPNLANAAFTNVGYWANTSPTSSVFTVGTIPTTYNTYVAYCFAEIAGYSAFGSYTGNGSTDGPFLYTGFKPAFIMTKRTDTAGLWWEMVDSARSPYNVSNKTLYANVTDAEYTNSAYDKDLLSNGFKIRGTNGGHNASGGTYIYMAFASNPFKYSLAR